MILFNCLNINILNVCYNLLDLNELISLLGLINLSS